MKINSYSEISCVRVQVRGQENGNMLPGYISTADVKRM
jgi:hypothetical protein